MTGLPSLFNKGLSPTSELRNLGEETRELNASAYLELGRPLTICRTAGSSYSKRMGFASLDSRRGLSGLWC